MRENHVKDMMEVILGTRGSICSFSKSCGPAMAVYNSVIFLNYHDDDKRIQVWNGDIVLDTFLRRLLIRYADMIDISISVCYESGGECWNTGVPCIMDGMEIEKSIEIREKSRLESVKSRSSAFGLLTPEGTEWTWYNTWYYKSVYVVYSYLSRLVHAFLLWPISYLRTVNDEHKIKTFFRLVRKELHYQRFEGGVFHFGPFKLKQ